MYYLIVSIIGYLFGCIHGSQIIGKIKKVDIKNSGVKNAGASNTTILLGWKYGIIVALIDIFKAVIPVLIFKMLSGNLHITNDELHLLMYLMGAFVIIGHNYPVTMGFKGGKGTASVVGLFFAIDWKMGLISGLILVVVTFMTDYLVIGVLAYYISFCFLTNLFGYGVGAGSVAVALTILSIAKHRENYKRIQAKTETKISSMIKKNKK